MKYLLISHASAFRFWSSGAATRTPQECAFELQHGDQLTSFFGRKIPAAIASLETASPFSSLDLLVTNPSMRSSSSRCIAHNWKGQLPPHSICKLSNSVLVASPAFLFVLLAQTASISQLIAYGTVLCSTYPLASLTSASAGERFKAGEPLATKAQLKAMIDSIPFHHGVKKANRALRWVMEGAASPREAEIALLLCTPRRYGGLGFPQAELNARIDLDELAQSMHGSPSCYPDFLWEEKKLILEYDSDEFHASATRMQADARRRNALAHMGYRVLTYTNEIFNSPSKRKALEEQLAETLFPRGQHAKPASYEIQNELRIAARTIPRGNV